MHPPPIHRLDTGGLDSFVSGAPPPLGQLRARKHWWWLFVTMLLEEDQQTQKRKHVAACTPTTSWTLARGGLDDTRASVQGYLNWVGRTCLLLAPEACASSVDKTTAKKKQQGSFKFTTYLRRTLSSMFLLHKRVKFVNNVPCADKKYINHPFVLH